MPRETEEHWNERLADLLSEHPEGLKQLSRDRIIGVVTTAIRAEADSPYYR